MLAVIAAWFAGCVAWGFAAVALEMQGFTALRALAFGFLAGFVVGRIIYIVLT